MAINSWQASPDSGDVRLHDGMLEIGYLGGLFSAVLPLGNVYDMHTNFGSGRRSVGKRDHGNVQLAATAFYSLRTSPVNCGRLLSGPMLPLPASGGCATEMAEVINGFTVFSPLNAEGYAALTTMTEGAKRYAPRNGDVYLIRLGTSATTDLIYVKMMVVETISSMEVEANATVTSVMIRWSNLYNSLSYRGGASFCDISASSPSLLTDVSWSNYFGPALFSYDDSWIAVILILYLIAMIIILFLVMGVAYWIKTISKDQVRLFQQIQAGPRPAPPADQSVASGIPPPGGAVEMETATDFL